MFNLTYTCWSVVFAHLYYHIQRNTLREPHLGFLIFHDNIKIRSSRKEAKNTFEEWLHLSAAMKNVHKRSVEHVFFSPQVATHFRGGFRSLYIRSVKGLALAHDITWSSCAHTIRKMAALPRAFVLRHSVRIIPITSRSTVPTARMLATVTARKNSVQKDRYAIANFGQRSKLPVILKRWLAADSEITIESLKEDTLNVLRLFDKVNPEKVGQCTARCTSLILLAAPTLGHIRRSFYERSWFG